MKTPREILFARHEAAEPKLDAIRRRVLTPAEENQCQKKSALSRIIESCQEFFRVPRIAWVGFAAAWLVIIALNIASSDAPRMNVTVASAPTKRSPEMLQALREQKRLFAELVGSLSSPEAEAPRFLPRPRSEGQTPIVFA
jgi:hypothetical protein